MADLDRITRLGCPRVKTLSECGDFWSFCDSGEERSGWVEKSRCQGNTG